MPNYQTMKLCVRLASPKIAPVVFLTPDTLPDTCFSPINWVGKIPWRRTLSLIPVFLPGESPWTEEPVGVMGSQSQTHSYQINLEMVELWFKFKCV